MSRVIKDIFKVLRKKRIVKWLEIRGCSDKQIEKLESELNIKLPEKYRDFLKYCGMSAGNLSIGTDMLYYSLFSLKEIATDLLKDSGCDFVLPERAFVFMIQQDYQFMYFDLAEESDDPAVYCYLEDVMDRPVKKYNSYTEYFEAFAEDLIKLKDAE